MSNRRNDVRNVLVAVALLSATACSGGNAASTGPATEQLDPESGSAPAVSNGPDGSASARAATDLVMWTDADRLDVLRATAATFTGATGVDVVVEEVDIDDVYGAILDSGPDGTLPDVFIGRHVWAEELVVGEHVVPLDLDAARDRFLDVALTGFNVGGRLYAVPASIEAMAMYRNTDLVAAAPAGWDGLVAACDAVDVDTCVAVPGGSGDPDAYAQFVFLSAFGGFVFGYDDASGFDEAVVGVDAAATIDGAAFLRQQVDAGVVVDTGYAEAKQRFLDGRAAFWLSGPWELDELAATDVPFGVSVIPRISDGPARPFVGATGWYVSANSSQAELAESFLVDHVATDATMDAFVAAGADDSAWSAVVRSLPETSPAHAFAVSATDGVAIPNLVAMADVWGPLGERLAQLRRGELDATAAMTAAADEIRSSARE